MIKFLKYLTQSIIIYSLFIFGKIIGLKKVKMFSLKFFKLLDQILDREKLSIKI